MDQVLLKEKKRTMACWNFQRIFEGIFDFSLARFKVDKGTRVL